MKGLVIALFAMVAGGVLSSRPAAAEPPKDAAAVLEQCLIDAKDQKAACIGRLQKPCEEEEGGETTLGMLLCTHNERDVWAARADTASAAIRARLEPKRLKLFQAADKAWREYRDAACEYDSSIYDGGSLEKVVAADCVLRETALRAIDLEDEVNGTEEGE